MANTAASNNPNYKVFIHCGDQNIMITADIPEQFSFDIAATYEAPFSAGFNNLINQNLGSALRVGGLSLTNQAMTAQIWQGTTDVQFTIPLVFQAESDPVRDVIVPIRNLLKLTMPREEEEGGLLESPGPRWDPEKIKQVLSDPTIRSDLTNSWGSIKSSTGGVIDSLRNSGGDVTEILQSVAGGITPVKQSANAASKVLSRAIVAAIKNRISLMIGQYLYFESVVITDVSQTASSQPVYPSGVFQRSEVNVTFRTFTTPTQRDIEHIYPALQGYSEDSLDTMSANALPW